MANHYYVCSRNRPPFAFDIADDRPADDAEIAYFIRAFRILEQEYGLDGYTVCFAWSARVALPRIGPDVIAVIYGDEHCRVPAYAGAVAAVIKCHGLFPSYLPRLRPLRLAQIELAGFLRDLALWLPTGWRWLLSRRIRRNCHLVPVGYGLPTEIEPLPFAERPYLTSFLGSLARPEGSRLRRLIGTPKAYCRGVLLAVLGRLQSRYGAARIPLTVTGGFQESLAESGRVYFEVLARTQLCVAPRGTARETLRLYEGLRFGCVVIADRLPAHPFYRDSPILRVDDWRELPSLIDSLLADHARLQALHERSLRYWQTELSETALARRCARAIGLEARLA